MKSAVITNIKQLTGVREETLLLRGKDLAILPVIDNAYLIIEDGIIAGYGQMKNLLKSIGTSSNIIDAAGQIILPAWCDSHTHIVFAAGREEEFVDKIKGLSYADKYVRRGK